VLCEIPNPNNLAAQTMTTVVPTSEEDPALSVVRFASELAWADAGPEVIPHSRIDHSIRRRFFFFALIMKIDWKLLKWFADLIVFGFGFNFFLFTVCCLCAKLIIVFVIWGKFRFFLIKLRCVCFNLFFIILVCSIISDVLKILYN
jgi:hypothetical protein